MVRLPWLLGPAAIVAISEVWAASAARPQSPPSVPATHVAAATVGEDRGLGRRHSAERTAPDADPLGAATPSSASSAAEVARSVLALRRHLEGTARVASATAHIEEAHSLRVNRAAGEAGLHKAAPAPAHPGIEVGHMECQHDGLVWSVSSANLRREVTVGGLSARHYVTIGCGVGGERPDAVKVAFVMESIRRNLIGAMVFAALVDDARKGSGCTFFSRGFPGIYVSQECSSRTGAIGIAIAGARRYDLQCYGRLWSGLHVTVGGFGGSFEAYLVASNDSCGCNAILWALAEAVLVLQLQLGHQEGSEYFLFVHGVARLDMYALLGRWRIDENHPRFALASLMYQLGACFREAVYPNVSDAVNPLEPQASQADSRFGQVINRFRRQVSLVADLIWIVTSTDGSEGDHGALKIAYHMLDDIVELARNGTITSVSGVC